MTGSLCPYWDSNCLLVPCFEEPGYERRIGNVLFDLQATTFHQYPCDLAELVWLTRTYAFLQLGAEWRYWARDVNFEWRMPTPDKVFLPAWHHAERLRFRLHFETG